MFSLNERQFTNYESKCNTLTMFKNPKNTYAEGLFGNVSGKGSEQFLFSHKRIYFSFQSLLPAIPAIMRSMSFPSESPPQQLHDLHRAQMHRHFIV